LHDEFSFTSTSRNRFYRIALDCGGLKETGCTKKGTLDFSTSLSRITKRTVGSDSADDPLISSIQWCSISQGNSCRQIREWGSTTTDFDVLSCHEEGYSLFLRSAFPFKI